MLNSISVYKMTSVIVILACLSFARPSLAQETRTVGKLREVFAWKQLTYDINGYSLFQDRSGAVEEDEVQENRRRRQADPAEIVYKEEQENGNRRPWELNARPRPTTTSTTRRPSSEANQFFIQYNNVPMGVERVGNRLFVTVPRRRYGIPSTLNYLDLNRVSNQRSPPLRPYPNLRDSRNLTSVYRTRADSCGRLWMVDTGLMEIPDNPQQVQPPAIVVYDLSSNRQIFRYPFKSADIPAANTPTGLASITVDISNNDCSNAFAYVPDLTTFGLIVYSLRDNDSWRLSHNYFHFQPTAGRFDVSGQTFQWSDGIFSITLTQPQPDGCRTGYFHPMVSFQEFSVSTCLLKNRTASSDSNYWAQYSFLGDRGQRSQATMHDFHAATGVVFFAEIGRDAVSCWSTARPLTATSVAVLAQHSQRLSYPADLHVTGDEVWVITNTLPRFGYARLDVNEYNFYIYKGGVHDLIAGTVCDNGLSFTTK